MQIFVPKASLTSQPDEVATVLASYDDSVSVAGDLMGSGMALMSVPPAAVDYGTMPPQLVQNWRNTYQTPVLAYEANRRIETAFPDYSQRNANAEINGYITQYGADATVWPAGPQSRKAEIDRCWTYVNGVRAKANAMGQATLPNDPTDDANWPTPISPYVPS